MESVNEVKEALSARSRTATLDELRSEGRKKVRLIKAEHVAAMIADAVNSAIEQSGLVSPDEVKRLVERSRQEFKSILKERESEVQKAQEVEEQLGDRERELEVLKQRFADVSESLKAARQELEELRQGGGAAAGGGAGGAGGAGGGGMSNELVMSLVQEMATLKANLMTQKAQPQAPAAAAGAAPPGDFAAAFEKLAGSLNDRLEKLGKKMGVSAAVEAEAVDFGGLFAHADKSIESNMGNIEVKQKAGGGIAANLARLKKLKGS
jgi:hypothetical protein